MTEFRVIAGSPIRPADSRYPLRLRTKVRKGHTERWMAEIQSVRFPPPPSPPP